MVGISPVDTLPYSDEGIRISAWDKDAQEDSLRLDFSNDGRMFIGSSYPLDFSREANGAMELVFEAHSLGGDATFAFGMGCEPDNIDACEAILPVALGPHWQTVRLTLSCFADAGVSMAELGQVLIVDGRQGQSIALSEVRIEEDTNGMTDCGDL